MELKLSIIIPAVNEAESIGAAVDSAWAGGAHEVLVVDGGSRDQTVELARQRGAVTLTHAPGRAAQLNAGARAATGDVLLFLHADNRLAAGVAQQIHAAMANPRVVLGGQRQRIDAPEPIFRILEAGNFARAKWFGLIYGDQGIFLRRAAFERIGGFPAIPLMEEVALCRRCRRLGDRVILPGPLIVSARRWRKHGVVRQTLRNWCLLAAYLAGISPWRLAAYYRRHDLRDGR